MSKIIVSYRRSDSQAVAGRIVDRLISHFGADAVFMDVDNIPFGIDFRDHIHAALEKAAVLIAIVGPDWLGTDADKRRRIDDEDDPVRVELETALRQKLLVVPVLVNNATMPKASALPESLRGFSFLNAAPVDLGRDFRPHVDRLIASIDSILASRSGGQGSGTPISFATAPPAPASPRNNLSALLIAAIAVIIVIGGGGAWWLAAPRTHGSGTAAAPPATPMSAPAAIAQGPPAAVAPDDIRWDLIKDTTDVNLLIRFIEQYPDSKHRADAERRIASLAQQQQAIAAAPHAAAAPSAAPADPDDEIDWVKAEKANSYAGYQGYVKHHPQGAHVAEAAKDAVAHALSAEPGNGMLPVGVTVLVDDGVCEKNEIKQIIAGSIVNHVPRTQKCVPRDLPF